MEDAKTKGIHHVGLTVPDFAVARRFFEQALGFRVVGEKPDYPAVFVSDGVVMVTLWQAEPGYGAVPFDRRKCIGLHHFALRIADDQTLEGLHEVLSKRDDVSVEFAPESLGPGPTRHMMVRIVGNIRMELIAPAG